MEDRLSFFAPCARGLEPLLAEELRRLRIRGVRPQRGGVLFGGVVFDAYRALLWTRFASRVLLSVGDADARSADGLYDAVREIAWEDHVRADGTIAVDAAGVNDALRNTQFTAVRVKDALADRFRDRFGRRPSVDTQAPELRINVVVMGERAKLAIDLSGEPLHRRGYREPGVQVAAPIKETLAAAVLEIAGWRDMAEAGGAFLDPLCGSATLPIEAAMMAADIAPGMHRRGWGFERWLGHDASAWERLREEAQKRRDAGLSNLVPVRGSDADPRAVDVARGCVRRAGLEAHVAIACERLADVEQPDAALHGLVACNPPYGERLSDRSDLPALYRDIGRLMRERFDGWRLAAITSDARGLETTLGSHAAQSVEVFNGRIPARVLVFEGVELKEASASPPDAAAEAFGNRLRKMAKHYGTWARRTGVGCYRVYDADLPDYNVAVDVYTGAGADEGHRWAHVSEYAAPAGIDEVRAAQRLQTATILVAEVLDIAPADVFVKTRERQRGSAQYQRVGDRSVVGTVSEGGLLFEVNLSDYLDTGLFLDHRDTRAWLRELVSNKRFLNLFAYTGAASVYAAAGGAVSTETVDLSQTYLDWAGRNLALNGLGGGGHALVRADVLSWVREASERGDRYDLIFCDPPTFSNSKRMDATWDVQRDHVGLVTDVAGLLAEDGLLVFSCNRRKFELDEAALIAAGLDVRDVTRRTIPKDFDRAQPPHRCWTIRR